MLKELCANVQMVVRHPCLFLEPTPETTKLPDDLRDFFVEALLWLTLTVGHGAWASNAVRVQEIHG